MARLFGPHPEVEAVLEAAMADEAPHTRIVTVQRGPGFGGAVLPSVSHCGDLTAAAGAPVESCELPDRASLSSVVYNDNSTAASGSRSAA